MNYKLEMKYKVKGVNPVFFTSEWLVGEVALKIGEELDKSGKATELNFKDEMGTDWSLKEMKKLLTEIEAEPHEVVIYFDGGYDRDTRKAGIGVAIYYKQGKKQYRLRSNQLIMELDDNNEAEYAAFNYSLSLMEELGVHHIPCVFKGDSQVVLKQLEGEWPCYEETLNRWLDRIEANIKSLGIKPRFIPISRKENKEADQLANQALEGKEIHSKMQILSSVDG